MIQAKDATNNTRYCKCSKLHNAPKALTRSKCTGCRNEGDNQQDKRTAEPSQEDEHGANKRSNGHTKQISIAPGLWWLPGVRIDIGRIAVVALSIGDIAIRGGGWISWTRPLIGGMILPVCLLVLGWLGALMYAKLEFSNADC